VNHLQLFLPCAAGVEDLLALEAARITGQPTRTQRGGVLVEGSWRDAMLLNLWSRLAVRVLIQLQHGYYRGEDDLYEAASAVAWEMWFTPKETFKIDVTSQHSPLKSLNFAALKVKDAVADRFRHKTGIRPDVDTHWPHVRIHAHLTHEEVTIYIDTSGEPLFKRGWREDKGDAPLKETLAAAMIAASGWDPHADEPLPLYDPCCGSGTIAIEAAQMALGIAPGGLRRFGFERLLPYQPHVWLAIKNEAAEQVEPWTPDSKHQIFGSDVAHRMVDFAQRNAQRAGVQDAVQLRGGDALQRLPPSTKPGVMLVNPPYGDRIAAAGVARGERLETGGEDAQDDFFVQLAAHWKKNFDGWTAWVLAPDMKLPGRMRLKESRRVPLYNGPIECRLFRFDVAKPAPRKPAATAATSAPAAAPATTSAGAAPDENRD
jgi:putative N6-adenine-specific DNA methylase